MPRNCSTRYVLNDNETPNQPVSHFFAKEWLRVKTTLNESLDCSICLEPIICPNCITVLLCSHSYHIQCIHTQKICPLCRG